MKKLKCYQGNYDGSRKGLVFAHNQREAATAAMTSVYQFRNFWSEVNPPDGKFEPLTLYTRPYDARETREWTTGRCEIAR